MFTIIDLDSRMYFHNKGRIILFETQQEAQNFMNAFIQYSMSRLMQEQRIHEVMQAQMLPAQCRILPVDFDINTVECGTVFAKDL